MKRVFRIPSDLQQMKGKRGFGWHSSIYWVQDSIGGRLSGISFICQLMSTCNLIFHFCQAVPSSRKCPQQLGDIDQRRGGGEELLQTGPAAQPSAQSSSLQPRQPAQVSWIQAWHQENSHCPYTHHQSIFFLPAGEEMVSSLSAIPKCQHKGEAYFGYPCAVCHITPGVHKCAAVVGNSFVPKQASEMSCLNSATHLRSPSWWRCVNISSRGSSIVQR